MVHAGCVPDTNGCVVSSMEEQSYRTKVQPPVYCLQMYIGKELMLGGRGKPQKILAIL